MISDENRGSGVSNRNRPIDNSIYIPPEVNAPGRNIDKDIVYITPGTADTRNEEPPLLGSPRRNESRGAPTRKKWPWWLFFVIGVLVIAVISAGIYYYYKHRMSSTKVAIDPTLTTTNTTQKLTGVTCDKGFFEHNGKCITCPGGTTWNGFECQIANGQPSLRTGSRQDWQFGPSDLKTFIHGITEDRNYVSHQGDDDLPFHEDFEESLDDY